MKITKEIELRAKIDWEEFYNLWLSCADKYEFYNFAKRYSDDLSFEAWDKAWQRLLILDEDPEVAGEEFIRALLGLY